MKRIIALLAVALVGLAACTKKWDTQIDGPLTVGLYACFQDGYYVAISTAARDGWSAETDCQAGYIQIHGDYEFMQTQGIRYITQDGYNGWAYTGLTILCVPKSSKQFTGRVLENSTGIPLPAEMDFYLQAER